MRHSHLCQCTLLFHSNCALRRNKSLTKPVARIPNLPFFYLVYRAWSHWRALAGGKHIQFLTGRSLLSLAPSTVLESFYTPLLPSSPDSKESIADPDRPKSSAANDADAPEEERILLSQDHGRQLVEALEIPELEVELERAIWQVEQSIQKQKKQKEEKSKSQDAAKNK